MKYKYLDAINSPVDLKKLDVSDLKPLCAEIRDFLVDSLSRNPGHLGANLGVVELSVALHYVMDTPKDRLVWDVGHQAYVHKILTGRKDRFETNRQLGGICGFPTPKESEYDSFGVGHSSTSISAALGMSIVAALKGEEKRRVVAVIGDGALTGGLAFEGLNNACVNPNNLLIVLNDNNMAIDPIKGGLRQYLTTVHLSRTYNRVRYSVYKVLKKMHLISDSRKSRITRFMNSIKILRNKGVRGNIFEGMNIRYFGPIDGHDVEMLVSSLSELKDYRGPKVLHIITKKGKGYEPAEKEVTAWHAPGNFNPNTGERVVKESNGEPILFQDVFGKTLVELARDNKDIVGISPAMMSGCSMNYMYDEMPERTFDVGIAEGHAVTFSAGLAKDGLMPFCNIYSTFMQRGYDNVVHDVALQNLDVTFCLDRAGIVGNDGATHQGQFDLAMFRCIPNMTIAAPRDEHELRNLMFTAQKGGCGPFVIRYPRGKGVLRDWKNDMKTVEFGKGEMLKEGLDMAVLTVGPVCYAAKAAIAEVEKEREGVIIGLYDMKFVKPLDEVMMKDIVGRYKKIITLEDGTIYGGFGSAVMEWIMDNSVDVKVERMGIPDEFIEHGTQAELYRKLGIDKNGIKAKIVSGIKAK